MEKQKPLSEPTEIYHRSRRNFVAFAGLLALINSVGLKPLEGENGVPLFGFTLESDEHLWIIFSIIVVYTFWQYLSSWVNQATYVRSIKINKSDYYVIVCIFLLALATNSITIKTYIEEYLSDSKYHRILFSLFSSSFITLISFIFAIYTTRILKKSKIKQTTTHTIKSTLLTDRLIKNKWKFIYNPADLSSKTLEFKKDGSLKSGSNHNENSWRVREGFLEILNNAGKIYSRFSYDETNNQFSHTNDEDTLSLKNQYLVKE